MSMRWPNGSQTRPTVTSPFGPRASSGGASSIHKGVDMIGIGQVRAIADGVVVAVGTPRGWSGGGVQVWIQHAGFFSRSMHLGGYQVRVGQSVTVGQIIGSEDTTGTVTGRHLHLEITLGNWHSSNVGQIDPVPFIAARISGNVAGSGGDPKVAQMQLDLNTIGYPLVIDGDYGPATVAAVTQFQKDQGLSVDGDAGPQTLGRLVDVVKQLQTSLNAIGYTLVVDGHSGPATVGAIKDFQKRSGLVVDGIAGPNTRAKINESQAQPVGYNAIPDVRSTADIQKRVGVEPDGRYGPATTAAVMNLQKELGAKVDGIWGPETDGKAFPPTPSAFIPFEVTGIWDKPTIRALQASLGFTGDDIDGDRGPKTIKAQQAATGMPVADQDGVDGPLTTRYLQASLGVRQDGQQGPETLRALQTLLNAGRKLIPGVLDEVEAPTPYPKPEAPTYPRATRWAHSVNSSPREGRVQIGIGHHWGIWPAPDPESLWDTFNNPNGRSVSPGVQINSTGEAWEVVPQDDFRPWTTGAIDHIAITFEMQNATGPAGTPPWGFSAEALEEGAQYIAWAYGHYGIPIQKGKVGPNSEVITPGWVGHNETPAGKSTGTTCPGSMPWEQMFVRALEIVKPAPDPGPTEKILVERAFLEQLRDNEIANADEIDKVLGG